MKFNIIIHEIEGEGYLCIKLADLTILKRKRKTFTPPTIEDVRAYCKAKHNSVDPVKWWNFYNAKGWMIGKTKMVNWRSAVATWEDKDTLPESKGTNLGGEELPDDYGVRSDTATQMPDRMKKRMTNIGKG